MGRHGIESLFCQIIVDVGERGTLISSTKLNIHYHLILKKINLHNPLPAVTKTFPDECLVNHVMDRWLFNKFLRV